MKINIIIIINENKYILMYIYIYINMSASTYNIKVSSDGESIFEAYHSLFSFITSTKDLYAELAKRCGSDFKYVDDNDDEKEIKKFKKNTIFCEDSESTHYKYFDASSKKIFDPYLHFQLYNTDGNCFGYALYLSAIKNTALDKNILIKINDIIEKKEKDGFPYWVVKQNTQRYKYKQVAYKILVHNDYQIINWVLKIVNDNPDIYQMYVNEWSTLTSEDYEKYGIPNKGYSFHKFISELIILASNIDEVYKMTLYQIENWDIEEKNNKEPYKNSGIQNSGEIDKNDYKIDYDEKISLTKMGGAKKSKRSSKRISKQSNKQSNKQISKQSNKQSSKRSSKRNSSLKNNK